MGGRKESGVRQGAALQEPSDLGQARGIEEFEHTLPVFGLHKKVDARLGIRTRGIGAVLEEALDIKIGAAPSQQPRIRPAELPNRNFEFLVVSDILLSGRF